MAKSTNPNMNMDSEPWDLSMTGDGERSPRVCDCCKRLLVRPGGIVEDRCFLTEYGLICRHCCLRGIPAIRGYKQGDDVSGSAWYRGIGLYESEHRFGPEELIPRLCDYCGRILISPDGIIRGETYLTEHEILCQHCIGVPAAICVYTPGNDVSDQPWWTGFCLQVKKRRKILMETTEKKKQEQIAIFRYALVAPALHMGAQEKSKYFQGLAGKEFEVPYYGVKKYGKGTFEEWLLSYRRGGLEALKPRLRCDKNIPRKFPQKILSIVSDLIKEYPRLSASGLYRLLIEQGHIQPGDFCESTLREYIRKKDLRQADGQGKERKKFEKEYVNELWIADFLHGPYIREGKKKIKLYLCAIIDDHSRLIVGSGWYRGENSAALAQTLKQAIAVYGAPKILYCDNAKVFRSNYLQLAAAKLGIALVHSRPYEPASRGKIERFFKTVRDKFLAALKISELSLSAFSDAFAQWLDKEYHKQAHRGIGQQRPLDKYLFGAAKVKIKTISSHELDSAFWQHISRKVKNDATISIAGRFYEVPPKYIGQKIELCFPIDQPDKIYVTEDGKPRVSIKKVNLGENANRPYTSIHFRNMEKKGEETKND